MKAEIVSRGSARSNIAAADRWLASLLLIAGLVLRLFYIRHFRIDSDEPQHLHVVWAWASGMLPYRDVFDNHSPVFQALCAPLFRLLGVHADILIPMRAAMLPIFGLTIYCVWRIAAVLFTRRTALWIAVLTAFCPPFFLTSIEFRPDELWTLLWLTTLAVLVTGMVTWRRALVAGLILGLSFCVSMKTTLFVAALLLALGGAIVTRLFMGKRTIDRRLLLSCAGSGLLGIAFIPAVVVLYFVLHGAGREMYYCVIQHNILPQGHPGHLLHSVMHLLLWAPLVVAGSAFISRLPETAGTRTRTSFVFAAGVSFYATLVYCWPILTAEDFLPFYPVLMITLSPVCLWLGRRMTQGIGLPGQVVPVLGVIGEMAWIVNGQSPLQDQTADKIGLIADTLNLTEATDYVMDAKGETVFRRRPYYYVLEALTKRRLRDGLMNDEISSRLIATRTPVLSSRRMTKAAREFVRLNYVPIAFRLRVLGQVLRQKETQSVAPCPFEVTIPARYTIVTPSGIPSGILDGTVLLGFRYLEAGHHEFIPDRSEGKIVLVWARAIESGYSPFAEIKGDLTTDQD